MSKDSYRYYPERKRYVPRNMEYADRQDQERYHRREPRSPERQAPENVRRAPRLNRAGRIARVVFICSLSLLLLICSTIGGIYVYIDSKILSNINFVDDSVNTIPDDLNSIVIEDDGDEAIGDAMSEEDAAALEAMIDGGLVDEDKLYREDGVINVLLLGTDSRERSDRGSRSDSMIILSINSKTKQIVMTSVMRDICVSIPGRDALNKINAAHAFGGAQLAVKTVEANFGIDIDRYISLNFYAFMDIVDALGGMKLDISEAERLVMNDYVSEINMHLGLDLDTGKLYHTGEGLMLTGKQVLGYVRNRYTGNGDFMRTTRQRIVLDQIIEKCKTADISTLLDVAEAASSYMTTNYTQNEIIDLAYHAFEYIDYEVVQTSLPINDSWSYSMLREMSIINIDFPQNRRELMHVVYGK